MTIEEDSSLINKRVNELTIDDLLKMKNIVIEQNPELLEEVIDLIDQPNVLVCQFNKEFLKISDHSYELNNGKLKSL